MTFREAIGAKAFDLLEATLRKFRIVTAGDHALAHASAKLANLTAFFESRHRAPQLIGFTWRKASGNNGNSHGLFLEQWDAHGFAQNLTQFLTGVFNFFFP